MIITTALAISAAAFAAAWVLERRARSDAEEEGRTLAEATSSLLRVDCEHLANELAKKQIEIEALEELQEIDVIQHLESTAQVTEYDGLPIYTWSLSSPYATLAEAVRHVPARR